MNNLRFLIPAAAGAALVIGGALAAAAGPTTIALPDNAQTQPDTPISIAVLANDAPADGYELSLPTLAQSPQDGAVTVDSDTSQIVYTPATGFLGTDVFSYSVCDTEPAPTCAQASVTVVVAAPIDQSGGESTLGLYPYASPYSLETQTGAATTVNVLSKDNAGSGDLDPASLRIVTQPADGSASLNSDGTLSYTPSSGFSGADSLVYQVCNTAAVDPPACDDGTVSIKVDQAQAPNPTPVPTVAAPAPSPTTAPAVPTTAPAAPTSAAPLPPSTGDTQPVTGSATFAWIVVGAGLLVASAGAGGLAVARRRRS